MLNSTIRNSRTIVGLEMYILSNVIALRCIYILAKLNGIIPFTFSVKSGASKSTSSRIYSACISTLLSYVTYIGLYVFINITKDVANLPQNEQLFLVYYVLSVMGWLKLTLLSFTDQWQATVMIDLINEAFELDRLIGGLSKTSKQLRRQLQIVCQQSSALCIFREITFLCQFNVCISSFLFVPFMKNADLNIQLFLRLYLLVIHFVRSLILFCGLLVVFQFFVQLNYHLKICMGVIEKFNNSISCNRQMRICCDISDKIDRLSALYTRCCQFYVKLNGLFAAQVLLTIIYSFSIIVCNVSLY